MEMDIKSQLVASRAAEKTSAALYALATSDGSLKERLIKAWFSLTMLSGRELPEEFQERFLGLHDRLTVTGVGDLGEGILRSSIELMDAEAAAQLARDTVSFSIDVAIAVAQ